ncbi:MAG: hypothetical protein FJ387_05110 [Verrucomicrobia bacterium]|nr:hypothetical protein [Verrucomicrobiota bacterium]
MAFQRRALAGALLAGGVVLCSGARLGSAADSLYAVGNDLWSINATTGQATLLFDITAAQVPGWGPTDRMNALALDAARQQLIFANAENRNLYRYALGSGTFSALGSLDTAAPLSGFGGLIDFNMDSGGTFYGGKYYAALELSLPPTSQKLSFMAEVVLDVTGTAVASASIYGGTEAALTQSWGYTDGFNDFGDFTVNPSTGELWAFTYVDDLGNPNLLQGLWHGNLATPGGVNVILASNPAWSQIAYNVDEDKLYAMDGATVYAIDKTTGATLSTVPLVGYTDSSGYVADLAAVTVPEPGAYALWAALGCVGYGLWRTRSGRK